VTTEAIAAPTAPPHAGSPRFAMVQTFFALMERDFRVLRREFIAFLARTAMQPALLVFVWGYILPKIGQANADFSNILVPGLVGSAVFLQGIQVVAIPLVQEFSTTREIEDRVMAPLPVWGVAAEKIAFAFLQAIIAGLVVFPFCYVIPLQKPELHVSILPLITVLPLGALASACLGLWIGTAVSPRQIPLVFGLIVLPVSFLGAVYYPWSQLDSIKWLQVVTLVNPMVYMNEGLRGALAPQYGHMSYWAIYLGLVVTCTIFTYFSMRLFIRRVVS
jgi:ABC-2 type transport system permease protein